MHPIARLVLLLAVAALVFWLVMRLRESTRGDKVSFRPVEDLPADVQQSIDHALAHAHHGPHVDAHLGALRAIGWQLRVVLDAAADEIDADPDDEAAEARSRALTVRHLVERSATEVLDRYGRAMGPGPLALDPAIAERHAGLTLYLRQSHAEADLEDLEHSAPGEQVATP